MKTEDRAGLTVGLLIIVVALAAAFAAPYFEMKAFNRCTDSKATYLDAVFTQLRVEQCTR